MNRAKRIIGILPSTVAKACRFVAANPYTTIAVSGLGLVGGGVWMKVDLATSMILTGSLLLLAVTHAVTRGARGNAQRQQ